MENIDLVKIVVEKVDECPNCRNKLSQKGEFLVKCTFCDLAIEVRSGQRRKLEQLLIVVVYVAAFAFGLGLILGLR